MERAAAQLMKALNSSNCSLALIAIFFLALNTSAQQNEAPAFQAAHQAYDSGRLVDAEKGFAAIVKADPKDIPAQMFLGQTLFREEKYAAAIVPYEKVRSLEQSGTKLSLTQHRILIDQLAMAYGMSGRAADSKALLQTAVRQDPEYPLNYYNLACVAADENDKSAVLSNLNLAFQHRAQALPGEHLPSPATDPSFQKFANDPAFKAFVSRTQQ